MSGNDLVRLWKDPDERGDVAHPAGEIDLDGLNGGFAPWTPTPLIDPLISWLVSCKEGPQPLW
jgi:hypothetical protein